MPLSWALGAIELDCVRPLRAVFLVPEVLWVLGLQLCWFTKLDVLRAQVLVLKVGVPNVEFEPFAPQGKSLDFEYPLDSGSHVGPGVKFMERLCQASPI